MVMTEGDIVLEYKQAKNPQAHIKILADENQCTRKEITAILRRHGLELPGPSGKRAKPEAPPEEEPEQEPDIPEGFDENAAERAPDLMLYYHAVQAIARQLKEAEKPDKSDKPGDAIFREIRATCFVEQVRGILALIHEIDG